MKPNYVLCFWFRAIVIKLHQVQENILCSCSSLFSYTLFHILSIFQFHHKRVSHFSYDLQHPGLIFSDLIISKHNSSSQRRLKFFQSLHSFLWLFKRWHRFWWPEMVIGFPVYFREFHNGKGPIPRPFSSFRNPLHVCKNPQLFLLIQTLYFTKATPLAQTPFLPFFL